MARELSESAIYSLAEPEKGTDTREFQIHGEVYEFTIETGGQHSAERWHELFALVMYGQTQQQIAKIKREDYFETFMTPDGKKVILRDPSYIGGLKLLSAVLVKPKLSFGALAVLGHKAGGKVMDAMTDWAAQKNGVSDYVIQLMKDRAKNLKGAADSSDASAAPA